MPPSSKMSVQVKDTKMQENKLSPVITYKTLKLEYSNRESSFEAHIFQSRRSFQDFEVFWL